MGQGVDRYIEFNGRSQRIIEWSKECGIYPSRIIWRINKGWSIEDVLTRPVRKMPKRLPQSIRKFKQAMRENKKNKKKK